MPKRVLCIKDGEEKWFYDTAIPGGWLTDSQVRKDKPSIMVVPPGMKLVAEKEDESRENQIDKVLDNQETDQESPVAVKEQEKEEVKPKRGRPFKTKKEA